jgi:hypothetical protein
MHPPTTKEEIPPATGWWQITIALIMITALLTVYLVVTLPTARSRGLLVSPGAVTHQLALAPLALSTKAPSGPVRTDQPARCFLRHSRHGRQCSHNGGTHAFGH